MKQNVGEIAKIAVRRGDLELLARAIEHGMGRTPMPEAHPAAGCHGHSLLPGLFAAVVKEDEAILGMFITSGMDLGWMDANSNCAVSYAASTGRIKSLSVLLEAGAGTGIKNSANRDGTTCVMRGAAAGQSKSITLLAKDGFELDAVNQVGSSALVIAVARPNMECIEALLAAGASPNARCRGSWAPLTTAILVGHEDAVHVLLAAGADIEATNKSGGTPLMHAVERGDKIELVKILVQAGANIEAKSDNGWTAAMLSVRRGNTEALAVLAAAGADLAYDGGGPWSSFQSCNMSPCEALNPLGVKPGCCVMVAARLGQEDCMETLMNWGANPNALDSIRCTALMRAAGSGSVKTVEALLRAGADVEVKSSEGLDAAGFAMLMGHKELSEMLGSLSLSKKEAREMLDESVAVRANLGGGRVLRV